MDVHLLFIARNNKNNTKQVCKLYFSVGGAVVSPRYCDEGAHKSVFILLSVWAQCILVFIGVSHENSDELQSHSTQLQRAVKWNSTVKE